MLKGEDGEKNPLVEVTVKIKEELRNYVQEFGLWPGESLSLMGHYNGRTFLSPVRLDFAIDFLDMDIGGIFFLGIFLTLWYMYFIAGNSYVVCSKNRDPRIQNPNLP